MPAQSLATSINTVLATSTNATNKRRKKMPALDSHEPTIPKA